MNICVCGWYGREFDEFYMALYRARKKHNIYIVAKKEDAFWKEMSLPYMVISNYGLEWAAYNYYLKYMWKEGDTLFTHDDVQLLPIIQNNETIEVEKLFDELAKLEYDQVYLFANRAEDVFNMGQHGRALFLSSGLLHWLRMNGGIWYDANNIGYTGGKRPPGPVKHYNAGTETFNTTMKEAKRLGFNVLNKVYVPAWRSGHRGKIKNMEELI